MEMQKHLPEVNMDKLRIVLDTKERYMNGELSLDDARAILREKVKTLRPYEIALAEQDLRGGRVSQGRYSADDAALPGRDGH